MVSVLSWVEWARCCWLEMVSGQKLCRILLRFFVGEVGNLFRSHSVILQHSEPYSRVESTQLWSSGIALVWSWCCTGMTSKRCSSFWGRFWLGWGDSWCCCPLHHHVWQCYQGRWTPQFLERLLRSLWLVRDVVHSASWLLSSSGGSSGLPTMQKCWDGTSSLACADGCVRPVLHVDRQSSPDLQALRRGSIWCHVVGHLLFATSPSQ